MELQYAKTLKILLFMSITRSWIDYGKYNPEIEYKLKLIIGGLLIMQIEPISTINARGPMCSYFLFILFLGICSRSIVFTSLALIYYMDTSNELVEWKRFERDDQIALFSK